MTCLELREWLVRLRNVVWRDRSDRDLQDELSTHAALAADRAGAADQAGVLRAMDAMRDQRSLPTMENLIGDLRHAMRSLSRQPLFAAVAIVTLALGTGANAAIFSVINTIVFAPLRLPQPEQLMFLTTRVPALGFDEFWVSPPEYMEFAELNRTFTSVGAYRPGEANVAGAGGPMRVRSMLADDRLFHTLGVSAAHGRWFEAYEAEAGGPRVAILSHELWQTAFGGRALVGETIDVDGARATVVGIMPPGFALMDQRAQIWLPFGLNRADRSNRASHGLYLVGRLKPGVTVAAADRELTELLHNWGELAGVTGTGIAGHVFAPIGKELPPGVASPGHVLQMTPMKARIIGSATSSVWVVQIAVAVILLIACANLASVLLARADTRRQELAIRAAVGASRVRLLQLFIIEGLLLSLAAGAVGLVLASLTVPMLARTYLSALPRASEIAVDPLVAGVTIVVSVLAGLVFGVLPLLHLNVSRLAASIRTAGAQVVPRRRPLSSTLVVSQVALTVVVTIAALLFVRTVRNLASADGGFDRSTLATFSISVSPAAYAEAVPRLQFYQRVLERVRALPGVYSASAMSGLPLDRVVDALVTDMEGYIATPETTPEIVDYYQRVMSGYFDTMGIPIVRGRAFEPADAGAAGTVAVVNESLARTFWAGQDPIGRRLRPCCADTIPWFTVIGVARDVTQQAVDRPPAPEFYLFTEQTGRNSPAPATMHIVLRTTLSIGDLRPSIERAIAEIDAGVPVVRLRAMDAVFDDSIRRPHLLAGLLLAFAGLALLLSAIGIYGLLAYVVSGSRKEIGIRMVIGANARAVVMSVIGRGARLIVTGVAAGLAIAASVNQWLSSLLFGITPFDATTIAFALAATTVLGLLACALPAWMAARVTPAVVLRDN